MEASAAGMGLRLGLDDGGGGRKAEVVQFSSKEVHAGMGEIGMGALLLKDLPGNQSLEMLQHLLGNSQGGGVDEVFLPHHHRLWGTLGKEGIIAQEPGEALPAQEVHSTFLAPAAKNIPWRHEDGPASKEEDPGEHGEEGEEVGGDGPKG